MKCLFCGERERCELFEVWSSGEFLLDTCCDGMRDEASTYMAEDPKAAAQWLATLKHDGIGTLPEICGGRLRRVIGDGLGGLVLDWNLEVVPLEWRRVREFVDLHHKHCGAPRGWRFGAGIRNGSQLVGVISVGRPVARAIDQRTVVEVNRLCVRRDVPSGLVWNACSMLYGWAAREARRRGFQRVITYTLQSEPGTTLRAAGWSVDGKCRARKRGWDAASRPRDHTRTPNGAKVRWACQL